MILGVKVTLLFGVSNTLLYVVQHKRYFLYEFVL